MKKTATKDIKREIIKNPGRIAAIFALIFISTFAFTGLFMTTKLLAETPEEYYKKTNLEDIKIISTGGLDFFDEVLLEDADFIEDFEMSKYVDLYISEEKNIVRIYSLNEKISVPEIIEGRLPQNKNEIALSYDFFKNIKKIGDEISFDGEDIEKLKNDKFKIVGFIHSPEYLMLEITENSSIGSGKLSGYGVTSADVFDFDYFLDAKIILKDKPENSYDSSYNEFVEEKIKELEALYKNRPKERLEAIKKEAYEEISRHEKEITDADQKLKDAEEKIEDAKSKLSDGEKKLFDALIAIEDGEKKYEDGKKTLAEKKAEGEEKIRDAENKLKDAEIQIADGKEKLKDGKKKLQDAEIELRKGEDEYNSGLEKYNDAKNELEKMKDKIRVGKKLDKGKVYEKKYTKDLSADREKLESEIKNSEEKIQNFKAQIAYNENLLIDNPNDLEIKSEIANLREKLEAEKENLKASKGELSITENDESVVDNLQNEGKPNEYVLYYSQDEIKKAEDRLYEAKKDLDAGKEKLDDGRKKFDDGKRELDENEQKLKDAEKEYKDGKKELEDAKNTLNEEVLRAEKELADAKIKIEDGKEDYREGTKKFEEESKDAEQKISDAEDEIKTGRDDVEKGKKKLADAKEDLKDLKQPTFMIDSRNQDPNYYTVSQAPQGMRTLTIIFSSLALAISMLLSLTTMTRMIDERRTLIGTYKGLGYKNSQIAYKFMIFGFVPGFLGAIIGAFTGQLLLAPMIYVVYFGDTVMAEPLQNFSKGLVFVAIFLSVITTTVSSYMSVNKSLKEKTAALLRPKPPKSGSRILLEKITPIWKRLSFYNKTTARNIFRYKSRMLMTIFGIAGCSAILILGFSMRFSISGIENSQYEELEQYDMIAILKENIKEDKLKNFNESIKSLGNIKSDKGIYLDILKLSIPKKSTQDVSLFVDTESNLGEYFSFKEKKSGTVVELKDDGILISEKLAEIMNVKVGDKINLELDEGEFEVKISEIVKNYVGHYIFMSGNYYEKLTGKAPTQNATLIVLEENAEENVEKLSEKLFSEYDVLRVISNGSNKKMIRDTVESFEVLILIIIIIAMLLAIVVLYNLTNINVSERIREISTMKVLGFYPKEITLYIYKETSVLTGMGIVFGMILGKYIVDYIIRDFAPINMKFGDPNYPRSYFIAALMTMIFSAIVMILMHNKLKRINMVEALKSVD